jgi:hypothetical protein
MVDNKDIRIISTNNILSSENIRYILNLPEVLESKIKIDSVTSGSIYFSVDLTPSIKNIIYENLGIQLENVNQIPMRWIKGDTLPHSDKCKDGSFDNTYLIYLTDCPGEFIIEDQIYSISKGNAFVFPEGVYHKTINTNLEPRLLLGPMNEKGLAVGSLFVINVPGGTTINLRDVESTLEYSTDNITWQSFYFPCGINNTSPDDGNVIFNFQTDISLNYTYDCFTILSDNIQIGNTLLNEDGTVPIITVYNVPDYPGLVNNGSYSADGRNNITITNLEIKANGTSSLAPHAGWFAQEYFSRKATGNLIKNCFTTAPIDGISEEAKGGIAGSHLAYDNGNISIIGCYTTGDIGYDGGGIVSKQAGENSGNVTISRCWSSGSTSNFSGGIVGQGAGYNNGTVIITNCYTTGAIGTESGGIVGSTAGDTNGSVIVSNCYSTGIIGQDSGGIIGYNSLNTVTVTNCFSTGALSTDGNHNAGGIFGSINDNTTNQTANHCYSCGLKPGYSQGGIFGGSSSDNRANSANNYSEENNGGSGWNDINAFTVLTGVPTITTYGSSWFQPNGVNTPLLVSSSGYSPYSRDLTNSYIANIQTNQSTSPGVVSGYTYYILQINNALPESFSGISINSSTGSITASSSVTTGIYSVVVYSSKNPYNISLFTLNITNNARIPFPKRGSNSYGQFWYGGSMGFPGFLYKKNLGVGARRSTKFAPGGNITCNGPQYIYNKYKPGTGGIGASNVSNRRAKNRLATVCGGVNGRCGAFYGYLGRYDNYTGNPNGYFPYP